MNEPIVSIITVCLNSEKYIKQTIESILNQTYRNIEYIVIDGQSKDGTIEIIKQYEPLFQGRMKWISEKDSGIYYAMNKGIEMAAGDILGIINSDDWYETDAVERIVKNHKRNTEAEFFYGKLNWINEDRGTKSISVPLKDLSKYSFKYWMPIGHPTAFVCRKVYQTLGTFNTKFKISADYEFVLRCLYGGIKFQYVDDIIANFREGGFSNNDYKTFKESTEVKILHGFNPIIAWYKYCIFAVKTFIRTKFERYPSFQKIYYMYKKHSRTEIEELNGYSKNNG